MITTMMNMLQSKLLIATIALLASCTTASAHKQPRRTTTRQKLRRNRHLQVRPRSTTALQNGVVATLVDGSAFDESTFILPDVPAGQRVSCSMTGDGNVNMAGRYGSEPTNLNYDCIGYIAGTTNEGCGFFAAKNDTSVYITTYAFSDFDKMELVCEFVNVIMLTNGDILEDQKSPLAGLTHFYKLDTPVKMGENVTCLLDGNGNANLYLRYGSDPEIFELGGTGFDCESKASGSMEQCTLDGPIGADEELYIAVDTMEPYDNLTIACASPIGYVSDGRLDTAGDDGCFSADTTVTVRGASEVIKMMDLKVGDWVLTSSGKYEPVYAFGHFHETLPMEYRQLFLEGVPAPLEVTDNHLLFLHDRPDPVRADSIQVGDCLKGQQPRCVVQITSTTKAGAYLPLTRSGTIVVNDGAVVASTYVSIAHDAPVIVQSFLRIISEQSLFHAWMAPPRMLCQYVSPSYCRATSPSNSDEDGIMTWLHAGLALAEFGEQQGAPVQVFGLVVTLMLLAIFVVLEVLLEVLLGSPLGFLLVVGGSMVSLAGLSFKAEIRSVRRPTK